MSKSNQILRPQGYLDAYDRMVLADKPSGYWKMNETSGTTVYDLSGNGYHGTIEGGMTLDQQGPWMGSASMAFNGSSGYIEVTPNSVLNDMVNNFTVEGWVRLSSTSEWGLFGGNGAPNGTPMPKFIVGVYGQSPNQFKCTKYGVVDIYIGTPPTDSHWHHIVCSYSSTAGVTIFVDGATNGTSSNTQDMEASPPFTSALAFGESTGGYSGFTDGSEAMLTVYPTVLTPAQVLAHYNAGRTALRMTGGMAT